MNLSEPFVLRRDVLLIPCADLREDVRARISYGEGDVTLSHRQGRAITQVIDAETASLLALFREPRTIADAIVKNSRELGKDPESWLDELLPHLGQFVHSHILVQAGSPDDQDLRPTLDDGAVVAGWEVIRCASLIEDSEVYEVRRGAARAALKVARIATPHLRALFDNEAEVLRHLDGSEIAPRLIDAGMQDDRPWLIAGWADGVDVSVAAAQRRHDRASLIELCASIATAYAALHSRGVLHADVHPRNALAGEQLTLIDFGYSSLAGAPSRTGRAGLAYFFEPEYVAAAHRGDSFPATAAGEQYGLAALLYYLLAGQHYLDFRYEREEMDRQVETEPPLPFASRGLPPWPEVEQILARALDKDPTRRFASVAEMAAQLIEARDAARRESLATPLSPAAHALLARTLQSFARGGTAFREGYPAPRASIVHGAAGAAVGLLRIAESRSDPRLLALANVWHSRAVALAGSDDAFYDEGLDLTRARVGEATPYHTESGVHAAAVMVAAASCAAATQGGAIAAFLAASNRSCEVLDLTLGRSGSLLAAAMLLAVSGKLPEAAALRAFGSEAMTAIWNELDAGAAIAASGDETFLGMAHGWTGYLYAAMRWCEISGDPLPARLRQRLHEFCELRTPKGRGVFWRRTLGDPHPMPGWCNGSGGQVFLFTLAHRLLGDDEWLRLAELSAWNVWAEPNLGPTLCCGSTGCAYALLNLYRHTGATEWLSRARQLANHAAAAASSSPMSASLWKGQLGVAVLIADLESPENARMPFFE